MSEKDILRCYRKGEFFQGWGGVEGEAEGNFPNLNKKTPVETPWTNILKVNAIKSRQ